GRGVVVLSRSARVRSAALQLFPDVESGFARWRADQPIVAAARRGGQAAGLRSAASAERGADQGAALFHGRQSPPGADALPDYRQFGFDRRAAGFGKAAG